MVLLNYIRIYLVLIKVGSRLPKAFYIKIRITKVNNFLKIQAINLCFI